MPVRRRHGKRSVVRSADDKGNAHPIVSQVLVNAIGTVRMHDPPSAIEPREMKAMRKTLAAECVNRKRSGKA